MCLALDINAFVDVDMVLFTDLMLRIVNTKLN